MCIYVHKMVHTYVYKFRALNKGQKVFGHTLKLAVTLIKTDLTLAEIYTIT